MLDTERARLFDPKREHVNLGITEGGKVYNVTPVVWDSTAAAYNMRPPEIFIAPEDLSDPEIMDRIKSLTVRGLYIYAALEDYSFIGEMREIWDLHIREGHNIRSLDFLSRLDDCLLLLLGNVTVDDMDVILEVKGANRGFSVPFRYLGLYDCNIRTPLDFTDPKCHFTELILWSRPENKERDAELWSEVKALKRFHYDIKPKG